MATDLVESDRSIGERRLLDVLYLIVLYYVVSNTQVIPMKRLTKKEIAEGMKSVPIETIILGSQSKQGVKLTKKQKDFAEAVVATGNKTEAYRRAYNHKGKNTTASRNAQAVVKNTNVQTYITALEAHKEVETYLLPSRLRAMATHKLSSMALNDDLPPAQQLKALELVGKMTEVSLFSERREIIHSLDASSLKNQLMQAVQLAINNSKTIQARTKKTAQQLLAEISEPVDYVEVEQDKDIVDSPSISMGSGSANGTLPTPQGGDAQFFSMADAGILHSIPDKELATESKNVTITPVIVADSPLESNTCKAVSINPNTGEGVISSEHPPSNVPMQTPPLSNLEQNEEKNI